MKITTGPCSKADLASTGGYQEKKNKRCVESVLSVDTHNIYKTLIVRVFPDYRKIDHSNKRVTEILKVYTINLL